MELKLMVAAMGLQASIAALALTACGRVGFDRTGDGGTLTTPDAPNQFGCGLRDLDVSSKSGCALDAAGALHCWGLLGRSEVPTGVALPAPGVKLSMGHDFACVLLETQQIRCFGVGSHGTLGTGNEDASDTPVTPVGDHSYVDLAASMSSTCAITANGALECWGKEGARMDGGDLLVPTQISIAGVPAFAHVHAGLDMFCVDTTDGRRFCWGASGPVPMAESFTGPIAIGGSVACGLQGGSVICGGETSDANLGDGRIEGNEQAGTAPFLSDIVAISGGQRVHCAVGAGGELWCWGRNRNGELGTGDMSFRALPTRIAIPHAARIALRYGTSCAETTDGVYCWGGDQHGSLGRGIPTLPLTGATITGFPSAPVQLEVSTRHGFGCGRLANGEVWCWGQGFSGNTGRTARDSATGATKIALPFAAAEIGLGFNFACARSTTQVACWGSNGNGGFGITTPELINPTPVLLSGFTGPLTLLTEGEHGMCVIDNGVAKCWDGNGGGPQPLPGLPNVSALTAQVASLTTYHQCALDTTGTAWCWGSNEYGELGRGNLMPDMTPAIVSGGRAYSAITASVGYQAVTCAIPAAAAAEVDCWGFYNNANLMVPTTLALSGVPVALVSAPQKVCAILGDGTRDCVGFGNDGDFGTGAADLFSTFTHVPQAATVMTLDSGNGCFVESGSVRCTGTTRFGLVDTTPPEATPMRIELSCR